ncbi:MAG TPA: aspartate carbamoyltransferase, partial [Candidatus Thorarchaeota archaeon]|nr:aspartate carbamoyltransferase [Candidatus Thorarchaeota archaeon]
IYMTRIQRERFPDIREYDAVKGRFRLKYEDLELLKENAIILHPLPRVDELDPRIDTTPHAKYFDQVEAGVVTRMAILDLILS